MTTPYQKERSCAQEHEGIRAMVSGGDYVVKEDGLQFQHNSDLPEQGSCTPEEFLVRFR